MLGTNNTLRMGETNFFVVNSNWLNQAVNQTLPLAAFVLTNNWNAGNGQVVMTNPATGAYLQIGTNGHLKTVDQFGTIIQESTNGTLSITQTNGAGILMSNGNFSVSGSITGSNAAIQSLAGAGVESATNIQLNSAYFSGWITNFYQITRLGGAVVITNNGGYSANAPVFTNFFTPPFTNVPTVIAGVTGAPPQEGYQLYWKYLTTNYVVFAVGGGMNGVTTNSWIVLSQPGN